MTLDDRFKALTPHRQQHSERVADVMGALAAAHGLPVEDARLAGRSHDLAREMARPALIEEARRLGIPIGSEEEAEPVLLHGPIAARWMERAGIGHWGLWEAVRYHTTAAPGIGPMAQALFVADGVEPGRRYPERAALYDQAMAHLSDGYCAVLRHTLAYLHTRGLTPHPDMVKAIAECDG